MKIKSLNLRTEEMEARRSKWHEIFLWWPTRISDTEVRWLTYYQRKGTLHFRDVYDTCSWWSWEWKPMDDEKDCQIENLRQLLKDERYNLQLALNQLRQYQLRQYQRGGRR